MPPPERDKIAGPTSAATQDARTSHSENICIALMGVAGSGKSSFAKLASRCDKRTPNHQASSERGNHYFEVYTFDLSPSQTIFLIETPHFIDSNTEEQEEDAFKSITRWMKMNESHHSLQSIIYFHRITDGLFPESAIRSLTKLRNLCQSSPDTSTRVVLCTTMWDQVDRDFGEMREQELHDVIEASDVWNPMTEEGGSICLRHDDTVTSAMAIISKVTGHVPIFAKHQKLDESNASAGEGGVDEEPESGRRSCEATQDQGDIGQCGRETNDTHQGQSATTHKEAEWLAREREEAEEVMNLLMDTQDQLAASERRIQHQTIISRKQKTELKNYKVAHERLAAENQQLKAQVQGLETMMETMRSRSPTDTESTAETDSSTSDDAVTWTPTYSVSLTKRHLVCIHYAHSSSNAAMPRLSKSGEDIILATFGGTVAETSSSTAKSTTTRSQPYAVKYTGSVGWQFSPEFKIDFAALWKYLKSQDGDDIAYITLGPSPKFYVRHFDGSYRCKGSPEMLEAVCEYYNNGYNLTDVAIGWHGTYFIGYEGKGVAGYRRSFGDYYPALHEFLDKEREGGHKMRLKAISLAVDNSTDFDLVYRREGEDWTKAQWHISDASVERKVARWWKRVCNP